MPHAILLLMEVTWEAPFKNLLASLSLVTEMALVQVMQATINNN